MSGLLYKGTMAKLKGEKSLLKRIQILQGAEPLRIIIDDDWREEFKKNLSEAEATLAKIQRLQETADKAEAKAAKAEHYLNKLAAVEWMKIYISTEDERYRVVTEMKLKNKRSVKEEDYPNDDQIALIAKAINMDVRDNQIVTPTEEQCEAIMAILYG